MSEDELPETSSVDQGELQDRAWAMVKEALTTGKMTLPTGKTYPLEEDGMLKLVQWLASKSAKARKLVPLPDEFRKKVKV